MHISQYNKIFAQWRQTFQILMPDEDSQEACLDYVSNLLRHDACVIFDFTHLCSLLGLDASYVASITNAPEAHYREFEIPKHSGGTREITAPHYSLMRVQRWIYNNILKKQPVHSCAHGFLHKRSIVTNVKYHLEGQYMLKLDLKDFFPSISKGWVIQVFRNIGYERMVALYLASICCYEDALPQGAPTSPAISNIVCRHLDTRLYNLAKRFNLHYTRYADDLAFSGDSLSPKFIQYVSDIIEGCGFELNREKIRLYSPKDKKILTGIQLKNGKMQLPRQKKRVYKQNLYYAMRYGIDAKMNKEMKTSDAVATLLGQANFWRMIEPDNEFAQKASKRLNQLYLEVIGKK